MNNKLQLHQVIAVEKGIKSRTNTAITEIHKSNQKHDLFDGMSKTYKPKDDNGDRLPEDKKLVQRVAEQELKRAAKMLTELFDISAARDWANSAAKADVIVDDKTLIAGAPITYLLFLEKQLTDIRTLISELPVLDLSVDWEKDPNSYLFKSKEPLTTQRTAKIQKGIVLAPATEKHPAQTQLITVDEVIGFYSTTRHSGAIPAPRKEVLLERVEKLLKAVKYARETANSTEAAEQKVGDAVFGYLLA